MKKRYHIQFPRETQTMEQDDAYFILTENDAKRKIRFHDYDEIYKLPGLYEQLFYDRLKCCSPKKVCEILNKTIEQSCFNMSELRILDLGAGNGMVGEILKGYGVSRVVGVDIVPQAADAADRDRPGVYDDYYVVDLTQLSEKERQDMESWSLDCLTVVAALGFGDIPVKAFIQAYNLLQSDGWVAFNIKESFMAKRDQSGFSQFIRELIFSEYLDLYHIERYRHRLSIQGEPLYYFALAGKKRADIPTDIMNGYTPSDNNI